MSGNNNGKISVIFRSLKYRNYRLFFVGQSISLIGTWMQRIAMPWLVYRMTGSEVLLGLVAFAGQIPTFLLSPVAGVLTDRWNKYKVLLFTQVISLVQASVLAWLCLNGNIQIWQILTLSIALGCVNAFDVPSRQSFVIDMVEKKEDLGNAIALNSMMFNGARLIGPSIAGIMLASTSEGVCFLINAISYIFVVISLLLMKLNDKGTIAIKTNVLRQLKEGLDYTFGFAPIKHLILLLGIANLLGMFYSVLMPVYAEKILHGGSNTFGFLMSAAGFGALIGALYLASRETILKLGRLIPASAFLFGAGLVALAFTNNFFISLILMVIIGVGMMLHTAASNTILQTLTDDDKRGRVMSFYAMSIMGTAPFSSLIAGVLAKAIGTPATISIGGFATMIGALIFYKKLPGLKLDVRPIYVKMGLESEVAIGLQKASESSAKNPESEL